MRYLVFFFVFLFSFSLYSQTISPSVVATAGNSYQAGATRIDWTLGEIAITTLSGTSIKVTQGFHQPTYIITDVHQVPNDIAKFKVYPNPTSDLVLIDYDTKESITISLIDISGKILLEKDLSGNEHTESISLSNFPNGLYFLRMKYGQNNSFTTHKIQKTN